MVHTPREQPGQPTPTDAIVLLSGGLDSAVTLALARSQGKSCVALSVDYGQRHRDELDSAGRVAASLGAARHVTVRMDLRAVGGSALTADIAVPKDRGADALAAGVPVTYVPARNMVFLSLAAGLAESVGAGEVVIGVNAVDYSGYPDCREEFIRAFEHAAGLGTRAGDAGSPLRIRAPLSGMSKAEIIRLGASLGVDFGLTRSCYDPAGSGLACGRCDACVIRARGFVDARVTDPTRYAAREIAR